MLHFDTRAEALRTPPVRRNWPVRSVLTNGKLNAALKDLLCASVETKRYGTTQPKQLRLGFAACCEARLCLAVKSRIRNWLRHLVWPPIAGRQQLEIK